VPVRIARHASLCLGLLAALAGCGSPAPTIKAPPGLASQSSSGSTEDLLASALTMLDQLERYNEQKLQLPGKTADGKEPQFMSVVRFANPETLDTVVDRLNLWSEGIKHEDWKPDPLLQTLPADLVKKLPAMERLSSTSYSRDSGGPGFALHDGWALQQMLWLRDAAQGAAGSKIDELERARNLFDWTVRNIQLVDPAAKISADLPVTWRELPMDPWHALLLGRGLPQHRAWIFMLLARQQELDVVLLARENPEKPGQWDEWAAALVDKKTPAQLHLFEPELGVPIPGPGGKGIATLAQVQADDALLRALDADAEHPYPLKSADLKKLTALVETGPPSVARRMHELQSHQTVANRIVLSADTPHLLKRLETAGLPARAWERPYRNQAEFARLSQPMKETYQRLLLPLEDVPLLWNGRASQLRARYTGERNAFSYYLRVHIPDEAIEQGRDHMGNLFGAPQKRLIRVAKGHAAYWMGLASYETGDYRAALNHLQKRTLEAQPDGPFTTGARYNLARVHEALGEKSLADGDPTEAKSQFARAAEILSDPADSASPTRAGNLLRARWLREKAK